MKKVIFILVFLFSGCVTAQNISSMHESRWDSSKIKLFLSEGRMLLLQKHPRRAIDDYFDKVIEQCEGQYSSDKQQYYAARSTIETLYYLARHRGSGSENDCLVMDPTCAEALYYKGYANLELGQLETAEEYLNRSIEMSPVNPVYLSELGYLYQIKNDFNGALDIYIKAEQYAEKFSPSELKDKELSLAKRGIGFTLIELGELDKAEEKYKECLEINSDDEAALHELKYIKSIRSNKAK